MNYRFYKLLNIKPAEYKVVRQLFLVQFFLGIATAFLFISTLTLFLHNFDVHYIPRVYLLSAMLLLGVNLFYAKLEHACSSRKLLKIIIIFSAVSLTVTWAGITYLPYKWLPFLLSGWNMVVYMLVGYAFWGMAAIIFNVRESKRIFSVVGAGDIPAKLMGYVLVPVLIPYIGVNNLLWLSVLAFAIAYIFLLKFKHSALDTTLKEHRQQTVESVKKVSSGSALIRRVFHNRLIFYIAFFSLAAFTIYALIDYTLLVEIKAKFSSSPDLAIFIGVFFAFGRILAIFFKLIFSSRVISRLGLANSLLISPVVLLLITSALLIPGESGNMIFYTFGVMVLLTEILKSAVQEPAFFVLFQPLEPHARLKGHLVAKGYMLPFALLGSGLFLLLCDELFGGITIQFIAQVLVGMLLLWIFSIYLVKKEYMRTLVRAIRKGWFTGTELFLNDAPVRELLLRKAGSDNPKDIILALELLERSGYRSLKELMLEKFYSPFKEVRKFVLSRLIRSGSDEVLPLVRKQLQQQFDDELQPELLKAYFYLLPDISQADKDILQKVNYKARKASFIGLLLRKDATSHQLVLEELEKIGSNSSNPEDKHLILDILSEAPYRGFKQLLEDLLKASSDEVCKHAMETVGKVREYDLLELVIKTAAERKAYYALQKTFVLFGDPVFAAKELDPSAILDTSVRAATLAAGKVSGENSTRYLVELLAKGRNASDEIIESLWLKQADLDSTAKVLVEGWVSEKLMNCIHKIEACRAIWTAPEFQLLTDALIRELEQDLLKLLKAYTLCYDRKRINRVMKLLQLGDPNRVANAVEILEHLIPKRYFQQTDLVIDFILDASEGKKLQSANLQHSAPGVISAVLKNKRMGCSAWTRSVACYLIPELGDESLREILETESGLPQDPVFLETKAYVLSVTT